MADDAAAARATGAAIFTQGDVVASYYARQPYAPAAYRALLAMVAGRSRALDLGCGPGFWLAEFGLRDDGASERGRKNEKEHRVHGLVGERPHLDPPRAGVGVLVDLADPDSPEEKRHDRRDCGREGVRGRASERLLHERREGTFIVSYETSGGWVAITKDVLTEVLAAGRDTKILGLPGAAAAVLRLMCPDLVLSSC